MKNHLSKKTLAAVLAVILILPLFPTVVWAANNPTTINSVGNSVQITGIQNKLNATNGGKATYDYITIKSTDSGDVAIAGTGETNYDGSNTLGLSSGQTLEFESISGGGMYIFEKNAVIIVRNNTTLKGWENIAPKDGTVSIAIQIYSGGSIADANGNILTVQSSTMVINLTLSGGMLSNSIYCVGTGGSAYTLWDTNDNFTFSRAVNILSSGINNYGSITFNGGVNFSNESIIKNFGTITGANGNANIIDYPRNAQNVTATADSNTTSITLSWEAPQNADKFTDINYKVWFSSSSSSIWVENISELTYTFTDLNYNENYTLCVVSVGDGKESDGEYIQGMRIESPPFPTAPTDFQATTITETSITVTWGEPTDNSENIKKYRLVITHYGDNNPTMPGSQDDYYTFTDDVDSDVFNYTFTGLTANTDYMISVYPLYTVKELYGTGSFLYDVKTTVNGTAVTNPAVTVSVKETGNGYVQLSWSINNPDNVTISGYSILVSLENSTLNPNFQPYWIENISANTTAYKIENLTNGTNYKFEVYAVDGNNFYPSTKAVYAIPQRNGSSTGNNSGNNNTSGYTNTGTSTTTINDTSTGNTADSTPSSQASDNNSGIKGEATITTTAIENSYSSGSISVTATVTKSANGASVAKAVIPVSILSSTAKATRNASEVFTFDVKTSAGTYRLPTNIISLIPNYSSYEDVADIRVTITDNTKARTPVTGALSGVIDFKLELVGGSGKTITEISEFNGVIERIIPIPEGTEKPANWGVYTRKDSKSEWQFVPAKWNDNGVIISSGTNSEYVVVSYMTRFTDIEKTAWYYENVTLAASKRLVKGMNTSGTIYNPENKVTRAEFITMIVRALRLPEAKETTADYADVAVGDWFYDEVMKAKSANLLTLIGGAEFKPNQPITREEMAYVLSRAATYCGIKTSYTIELSERFTDASTINGNYARYVENAVSLKLMQGMSATTFDGKGMVTRAQAATVLVRMCQTFGWIE